MGAAFLRPRRFDHAELVGSFRGSLRDRYEVVGQLGAGAQGVTYLIRGKDTSGSGVFVAKETHDMTDVGRSHFVDEFRRMRELRHPHCAKVIELVEDALGQIYVISEYAAGSDLFKYMNHLIGQQQPITEEWVAAVFRQAMHGVAYLHEKGVVHNDLKPDNILILEEYSAADPGRVPWVAINDFGCATSGRDTAFSSGDPRYQSSETWRILASYFEDGLSQVPTKVGPEADVWSMGATLFELLSGGLIPFLYEPCSLSRVLEDAGTWARLRTALLHDEVRIRPHCLGASPEVETLLLQMFQKDPARRPSAVQVLQAPWFSAKLRVPIDGSVLSKLEFNHTKGLGHAILLNALATTLKHEHYRDSWKVFQDMDTSLDGSITFEEFGAALASLGRDAAEARRLFEAADIDGDGKLIFTEFMAVTFDWKSLDPAVLERSLRSLFKQIDANGSGQVSPDELDTMFQGTMSPSDLKKMVQGMDLDGDGNVSLEELKAFLFKPVSPKQLRTISDFTAKMRRLRQVTAERLRVPLPAPPAVPCFAASCFDGFGGARKAHRSRNTDRRATV